MRPLQILLYKWLFFLGFHICEMLNNKTLLQLFQSFDWFFFFKLWEASCTLLTLLLMHLIANDFLEVVVLSNMPEVYKMLFLSGRFSGHYLTYTAPSECVTGTSNLRIFWYGHLFHWLCCLFAFSFWFEKILLPGNSLVVISL